MDLSGRTALVTGANRGIGRAVAEALAARPLHRVLAGVRDPDRFEPLQPPPGGAADVLPVALDLSSRESIDAAVHALGDGLGEIDVLVNNAGQFVGGLLEEQDTAAVYAMLQVNLVAVMHLTQRVLPAMVSRGSGTIVNNTSIVGYAHMPAVTTYAASKAGVVGFSEALRRELRGTGVHVMHVVTPGVRTDMLDATDEQYGRYADTSSWDRIEPAEWAGRIVGAIESGDDILGPGGKTALAKLASRGPAAVLDAAAARMFSRQPRSPR
jgi:short-subunit dehydrogenase